MNVFDIVAGLLWIGGVVLVTLLIDYLFKRKYRMHL